MFRCETTSLYLQNAKIRKSLLMQAMLIIFYLKEIICIVYAYWRRLIQTSKRRKNYNSRIFAFDFTVWNEVVLFLIFFATLGFLCIKHNYFSVNIVLEYTNFKFYSCIFKNEDGIETEQSVISHRKLTGCVGYTIYLKSLNNEYKLDITQ